MAGFCLGTLLPSVDYLLHEWVLGTVGSFDAQTLHPFSQMEQGIHRNVIHPKFGNFILLGTVLVAGTVTDYTYPIDHNPCLECRLCVSACPIGAIAPDGYFNFSACYTHNDREFMSGLSIGQRRSRLATMPMTIAKK